MKQVMQDLSKGGTALVSAPAPKVTAGTLLIDTTVSLISTGTERMLLDFGKASVLQKARQQPDKVRQVIDKVQTDGLMTTIDTVRAKLSQPIALGYSNVGIVRATGKGVTGFKKGDRILSNGPHADVVRSPKNLCAKIPDNVSDEAASFTVLGAIGLQGIRLAQPTLGECFVVTGVGLIGLLTVQLLRAQGCRVLAIDFDAKKLEMARKFGAETCNPANGEDPVAAGMAFSRGRGVDGVIITASTKSSDPVTQAAHMCRQRGRIVLVGVTGLELSRADFYEKELSFQVSCSYGPGRYDSSYEDDGHDYPVGFVRWTQQRNFEAVLDMLSAGSLDVSDLVSHRFGFESAVEAYGTLSEDKSALGILLEYKHDVEQRHSRTVALSDGQAFDKAVPTVGFIGAGNYASRILIPAFKAGGAALHTISSSGGVSGVLHGEKSGFSFATTDTGELINNPDINTVAVATRHDSHADFSAQALRAGKNVFVEKPLALTRKELKNVQDAYEDSGKHLMVGFNRRFAPQVQKMKQLLDSVVEPKSFVMVMNAGAIPVDHWTQDPEIGGGRIIGEACHYIDLMRFLAGDKIVSVQARRMGDVAGVDVTEDKAAIILGFANGSFGTIHYLANGAAKFPKERIEVFAGGKVLQLDNFLKLNAFGWKGFKGNKLRRQDKGQNACAQAFLSAIENGQATPINADELFEVTSVTLDVAEQLKEQV
jgi:predicted dehydrogenase/threonine dehydrogenase-like Zn-dependent dehydrogenase